jgi:hypothetical protein
LLLVGAFGIGALFAGGDGGPPDPTQSGLEASLSQTPDATDDTIAQAGLAGGADTETPTATTAPSFTATAEPATDTPAPTRTNTPAPTDTEPAPTNTPTAQPTRTATRPVATNTPSGIYVTPTSTPTPIATEVTGPYVRINEVTIQGNDYVIDYDTLGFYETLEGWHTHFFFNTVSPEQAGLPGSGPWKLHYGPSPFTGWKVTERPPNATQMCARVANADHSLYYPPEGGLNTGNCVDLP